MDKFVIKFDNEKGKGLYATVPIVAGEVIFEEKPLICSQFLWNAEYKYDACEFCLAPLENAEENARRLTGDSTVQLPYLSECCCTDKSQHVDCTFACGVRYCSQQCRNNAWTSYHRILCFSDPNKPTHIQQQLKDNLQKLCDSWKSIHYPPETISIMLIVKILASILQSSNPQDLVNKYREFSCQFSSNADRLVCKLVGEQFQTRINIIKELVANIVYHETLSQFFTDQGFVSLLALIGQNGQGIGSSPFSEWAKNCERFVSNDQNECLRINQLIDQIYEKMNDVSSPFLNNEGSGLYQIQSLINHSCDPNAEIHFPFNNNTLAVKAVENIGEGDEILTSYLDECILSRSRHSRNKFLENNYLFTCNCRKCQSQVNLPDVTSDEDSEDHTDDEEMFSD